jgi:hypothetical protein
VAAGVIRRSNGGHDMAKILAEMTDVELVQPLDNDKHCEILGANARVAGDAMRDGFKMFVQLMSAIVGGAIALRLSGSSIEQSTRQTEIARLADGFVMFVGIVSGLLIADSFRSWRRNRTTLTTAAGKRNGENVVQALDWQSWITITVMEIVIAGCVLAFWIWNPLRLKV